jgi:DNA primase
MAKTSNLLDLATNYNKALPARIRGYLNGRGISDAVIDFHLLGWNGWRITIPVFNCEGEIAFFKLAKDPEDQMPTPKMMASPGAYAELYGWGNVLSKPTLTVICEGEFDRLVLESNGLQAVTSTGGAGVFRLEWAEVFKAIPAVYVCFDRDEAGRAGALRVAQLVPQARVVELPEEVGEGGDVTDFFVRLGKTKQDFLELLEQARPAEPVQQPGAAPHYQSLRPATPFNDRIERLKSSVSIEKLVSQYVKLRRSGNTFSGICPFHDDHNPSLAVYPATGTFHCYGCRAHGDAIKFLMAIERLSFGQALDALEQLATRNEPERRTDN